MTGYRGFETMSISEIYGEFRMFLILQHVDGVLNYARLWKDTDLPYYGCHGPAAKGEEIHPVTLTRDLLNEPQEMGGAEGKVAWIGEFLPILSLG